MATTTRVRAKEISGDLSVEPGILTVDLEVPAGVEERISAGLYTTLDNLKRNSGYAQFRKDLLADLGIADHPKAERFFELVWDMGHSSGYNEVYIYACEWCDLLT